MFAFTAPLDYRISATTVLVPDLLVTPVDDLDRKYLDRPPVLVVEVLSPSTRRVDLHLKKAVLEEAGVPAYWVVDPKSPMLTAFRLVDGSYVADPTVIGRGVYETEFPFPVRVVPADLVRRD
jgi:Uma2 family endonuclease